MEKSRLAIGKAAKYLEVSVDTLRRWDASGKFRAQRSAGGHRYYRMEDLKRFLRDLPTLGWAWATSAQPPELSPEYYSERQDRFTSRLEKMSTLLLHANAVPEDIVSLLTAVAGEIGDNSFAHNIGRWPDVMGVFFAYDIEKRLIVLADRGQGVRATLRNVRPNLESDADALRVAFTEIVSGRGPEKRGNGLKVVRSIAESGPIGLQFRSGLGVVRIPKPPGPAEIGTTAENVRGAYAVITF